MRSSKNKQRTNRKKKRKENQIFILFSCCATMKIFKYIYIIFYRQTLLQLFHTVVSKLVFYAQSTGTFISGRPHSRGIVYEIKCEHYKTAYWVTCTVTVTYRPELRKQEVVLGYNCTQMSKMRLPFHFCISYNTQETIFVYSFNVCVLSSESKLKGT